ncbi:MAG: hypothetical protein WBV22_12825 [Anaerolineaceae bacterium]
MESASDLVQAYNDHPLGLCGRHEPARITGSVEDLEKRINILTLGVVLDINPLSQERWSGLVLQAGHWLADPSRVAFQTSQQVLDAMREEHIQSPQYIARVWWQICRGVQGRFKGSWRDLIKSCEDDTRVLQGYLEKSKSTFPVLSGPVISARWLDLVHRIGGVSLKGWEKLSVPVSGEMEKNARLFGIEGKEVHPQVFNALWAWPAACKRLADASCGLGDCPHKVTR